MLKSINKISIRVTRNYLHNLTSSWWCWFNILAHPFFSSCQGQKLNFKEKHNGTENFGHKCTKWSNPLRKHQVCRRDLLFLISWIFTPNEGWRMGWPKHCIKNTKNNKRRFNYLKKYQYVNDSSQIYIYIYIYIYIAEFCWASRVPLLVK